MDLPSVSNGTTSHSYTYGNTTWRDLLTKYDGHAISYDASGNPTTYYNGKDWTMAWAEGRRLVSANGDGKSLTFTYDSEGLRLTKKVGSTTYNYSYAGGKLLRQTGGGNTLDFFYDASGNPYALKYNGTLYYYITNLQGDVLHIVNTSGTPVVSYSYTPYGKPTVTSDTSGVSLGTTNPLRYRGYVYDTETGLYYLQSRYYDPSTGRFINADGYASTGQGVIGCNMFAYCLNRPINASDSQGNIAIFDDIAIIVIFSGAVLLITAIMSPSFQQIVYDASTATNDFFTNVGQTFSDTWNAQKPKNLPAWKKLKVNMDHILSGHSLGGSRNPKGNKSVFHGLTSYQILKAIQEAYNNSSKIQTQGERVLLRGFSSTYNLIIEMWLNLEKKIIETAYPVN